jgi:hypothetical protein
MSEINSYLLKGMKEDEKHRSLTQQSIPTMINPDTPRKNRSRSHYPPSCVARDLLPLFNKVADTDSRQ